MEAVSHSEMEHFISEVIRVLRDETRALVTVGATAMKWKSAWSQLDLDFHRFHIYDWNHRSWPCTSSPESYDLVDKPVVIGESDPDGIDGDDYPTVVEKRWSARLAGSRL